MIVSFYRNSPLSPFPGTGLPLDQWAKIFSQSNTNSPTIGKSVNKDICGGALDVSLATPFTSLFTSFRAQFWRKSQYFILTLHLQKVNLRVHAVDSNSLLSDSLLANFDCLFTINPREIAKDANSATWGQSTECTNTSPNNKIKYVTSWNFCFIQLAMRTVFLSRMTYHTCCLLSFLPKLKLMLILSLTISVFRLFARQRSYQIPSTVCRSDSSISLNSDSGALGKREGQHDFIRIEYQIIQLLNPQGITADGKKCSHGFSSTCNPKITVLLDTWVYVWNQSSHCICPSYLRSWHVQAWNYQQLIRFISCSEKALSAWPGSKTVPNYDLLSQDSGTNSPVINKNVGKNVCGGSVRVSPVQKPKFRNQ